MVRVRDNGGDLTPYYDELDRRKAEKLRRRALARERRGQLSKGVECVFVWVSIVAVLPVWILAHGALWVTGRSLDDSLIDRYGEGQMFSAVVIGMVAYIVAIIVSSVIYWNSTQTFCERHSGNLACIQMDIDKQQADLNKLRSKQDK